MEEKKIEKAQLEEMKKRRKDSRRKLPSTLYKISFDPSPTAQKILGLQKTPLKTPDTAEPNPSPDLDPLPFPTLCSALKEDVLRKTPRRRLFSAPTLGTPAPAPKAPVPAARKVSKLATAHGCPSKDGQPAPALNVASNSAPVQTGNSSLKTSQCEKKKSMDESLCNEH